MAPDRSSGIYISFMLLGGANLLPWLTNLSLADYYAERYGSNLMEFAFPAASTSVLLLTCCVLVCYGTRFSFHLRIAKTSISMAVLILSIPFVDMLLNLRLISMRAGLALTILAISLNAMCSAVAQNALFSLASLVGDHGTQALQAGNGAAGLISVLLRVATKLGLNSTASVWIFTLLAAATILLSLIGYYVVTTDDIIVQILRTQEELRVRSTIDGSNQLHDSMLGGKPKPHNRSLLQTFHLVWLESASVFIVFLVCLSCFPGMTTSIQSTSWALGSWYPIILIAAYNLADFIGKSLPTMLRLFTRNALPFCILLHLGFIPVFLLLLNPTMLPSWCQGDLLPLLIVGALGICTGYIGCMCLVLGAERGTRPEERELSGMITSFSLMLGLCAGSNLGLAISTF